MPIYEYKCDTCGKVYEELVTGDRNRKIPCPACGSDKTRKVMSVIGGISMGSSADGGCGSSCAKAPSCAMAGGAGARGVIKEKYHGDLPGPRARPVLAGKLGGA